MEYRELTKAEREKFDDDLPEVTIGAFEDNVLVALCGISPWIQLDPVWVRPDKRRQGMVKKLFSAVSDNLMKKGVSAVTTGFREDYPEKTLRDAIVKICSNLGGFEIKGRFFGLPLAK